MGHMETTQSIVPTETFRHVYDGTPMIVRPLSRAEVYLHDLPATTGREWFATDLGGHQALVVDQLEPVTLAVPLVGFGSCAAMPAGLLAVGHTTVWNFGYTDEVVGTKRAGNMVTLSLRATKDGETRSRRMRDSTLVGVV